MKQIQAKIIVLKAGITKLPNILMLDGKTIAPKETIEMLFGEYIECYQKGQYSLKPNADELAKTLDKKSLAKEIIDLYDGWSNNRQKYNLLPVIFRFCDWSMVSKVYHSLCVDNRLKTCVEGCLLLSDAREAMILVDKKDLLKKYASIRKTTDMAIRNKKLNNYEFNNDGKKFYDLGSKSVEVSLNKDFSLTIIDLSNGKVLKSIPKKGIAPALYKEVTESFNVIKKTIKKVTKNAVDNLFKQFLSGEEISSEDWIAVYIDNVLLRILAELIVWSQSDETFILRGKVAIKCDGTKYEITNESIKVAHPIEMKVNEIKAWQQYFIHNQLKQPFEQVWENVYHPEDITGDRYAEVKIPLYRFLNQDKHGIHTQRDFLNFDNEAEITMNDCNVEVGNAEGMLSQNPNDLYIISLLSFQKYTRQVNHIIAYLDKVTIYDKINKDDVSIINILEDFNLSQILKFIEYAVENNRVNVAMALLNYKNEKFGDSAQKLIWEL